MKNKPLFYLSLITLFGAIFRIWFFWKDGLHVDEYFTINLAKQNIFHIIQYSLTTDCNPPLFYLIDHYSLAYFGVNSFGQRLPSVIFGILLIPAVYVLGKELKGQTLGLLTALAVATLGPMWYYSQFGRVYMLECLLFTIFCIYFIRLVRGDSRTYHWIGLTGMAVLLAYAHLFAVIPLSLMFLYLIYQYRFKAVWWTSVTVLLASPLLLLFNAILKERTVSRTVAKTAWDWYGATVPQIVIFAPLEFFSYTFVFWIPMIVYSTWIYRTMKEVLVIIVSFIISFIVMLSLADSTPVFIRYVLLFVPILVTIGLLPVADLLDNPDHSRAQKWFIVGSFGIMYFLIIFYGFWSGLYLPKGTITI
jgi:4-amino-4-deoxy-L-arabinose transferase-like glycosyltransferase